MRGIWFSLLVLAWVGISPARATGLPACGPRETAVQHLFCGHAALAAMDRSVRDLAGAPVRATARQHRAARRDQRLWQAQRDDLLWRMMSNASYPEDQIVRAAWQLERSRQAFLLGRAGHGAVPFPPLPRMARVLRTHRDAKGDPLAVWARFDRDVVLARSLDAVSHHLEAALAPVELEPGPELRRRVDEMTGGYDTLGLLWLSSARLGAVVSVQGTAHCQYLAWFRADHEGTARLIPSPMLDQAPCGNARPELLQVGDATYMALEQTRAPYATDISLQRWLYGRWTSPVRIRLRYDHGLEAGRLHCMDGDCGRYLSTMMRIARRHDARPEGRHMTDPGMPPDLRTRARKLLRVAQEYRKTTLGMLPLAGGEPYAEFCSDAGFFLVRIGGRLLLGRIGYGYIGWRRSQGWRIGLWDMHGGKLVPVASAVIRRPRGRLLALAAMPPEVIPTR